MSRHRDPDWMISWSIFGELTQSLCPAKGGPSHFYLSAYESQLSPQPKKNACSFSWAGIRDPDWIQTNDLLLSIPLRFSPLLLYRIWGLDYNFTITGVPRLVSTEPFWNCQRDVFPLIDYSATFLPLKWLICEKDGDWNNNRNQFEDNKLRKYLRATYQLILFLLPLPCYNCSWKEFPTQHFSRDFWI